MENSRFGNIEHDIEHFRPKAKVGDWPTPAIRTDRVIDYTFAMGAAADPGYFLLPYHPENYLIACKSCNSALKAHYFPVEAARRTTGDNPRDLTDEKALLIYPLGTVDTDPETLITFDGILPVPVATQGRARRRALVTIDFFALDSREILLEERAATILALHLALENTNHPNTLTQTIATTQLTRLTDRHSPHANCARAFHDLWLDDQPRATAFTQAALTYLDSLN